ncbi:MAG: FAD-dependent oxidoreductase [Pseudomonadota bacterium]
MRLKRPGVREAGAHVTFTFDGRPIEAIAGESIASALAATGNLGFSALHPAGRADDARSARTGLYCGMGACFACVVTIDGRAGQRACLAKVEGGEEIRSTLPSGRTDDPLQPLGDAPARAKLAERVTDILVIGAGPAGLSAALAAGRCGASVVLLDERTASGGQYYKPMAGSHEVARPQDRQFRAGASLLAAAHAADIEILQDALVFGAFSPNEVLALIDGEALVFKPRRLILATGAYERPMPVPGWHLPGAMTTGAMQTLARGHQVSPGRRIVVAGNGPLNFQLAADLVSCGVEVAAVVEAGARPSINNIGALTRAFAADALSMTTGLSYLLRLKYAGVPIFWSHVAIAIRGLDQVEAIEIAPVDDDGRPDMKARLSLDADGVGLGYGFIASTEMARALGCEMRADPRQAGGLAVDTSKNGATSIDGVFAVGDGASVGGATVALAEGELAGITAAGELSFPPDPDVRSAAVERRLQRASTFQEALWKLFHAPPLSLDHLPDDTTICRCEHLDLGLIRKEIDAGASSLAVLKRRLRLGMGRCQGRYCIPVVSGLLQEKSSPSPGAAPMPGIALAPRLPVKPFPLAALAIEKAEWGGHQRAGSPDLARPKSLPPFDQDETAVLVIGGGVVGACLAHDLAARGEDVLVVERDDVNLQASGANAGSLHVQLLSFDFGAKAEAGGGPAAATLPLGPWAVSLWQDLAALCGNDFEIRITGGLMVAESEAGMRFLRDKVALERSYGLDAEIVDRQDLQKLAPALSDRLIGAEYSPGEGKINPLTATYSVMHRAREQGARLMRSTDMTAIERTGRGWRILTNRGVITAGRVINAAGPWARSVAAMAGLDLPVYSAPLQMIVTDRAPPLVDQLVAHADRHLSLKQLASGGVVIGGAWTARYSERQNMNITIRESIEGNLWVARRVLPALDGLHVLRSWAGMNVNIDGAPIIGEVPAAPGFFNAVTSNGYTLAPAVARLTADLICDGKTEIDIQSYRLERFDGALI